MNTRTLGKILGALGLVALLSAPYTYFVTTGSPWMSAVKAALGLLLIGAYFATNLGEFGQFASRRSTFYLVSTIATVLVVLVALVAVNYVVAKKGKSWDLTSKKIFTLAPQTESTLGSLKEKVRAYAFLAPSDPDYEQVEPPVAAVPGAGARQVRGGVQGPAQGAGPGAEVPAARGTDDARAHPRRGRQGEPHHRLRLQRSHRAGPHQRAASS